MIVITTKKMVTESHMLLVPEVMDNEVVESLSAYMVLQDAGIPLPNTESEC